MLCRKPAKHLSARNVLSTVKPSAKRRHDKVVRENANGKSVVIKKFSQISFPSTVKPSAKRRHEKRVSKNVNEKSVVTKKMSAKISPDKKCRGIIILKHLFSKTCGLSKGANLSARCRLKTVVRCCQRLACGRRAI
jgi:hypothetical protein